MSPTLMSRLPPSSASGPPTSVPPHPEPGLLHRSLLEQPHMAERASRSHIYLHDGSAVLDGCGGAAVAIIGQGNQEVISAVVQQMQQVSYVHTGLYSTTSAEHLAHAVLAKGSNGWDHGLRRAFFVNGGSEANDAAMKCARQYWFEKGETQRKWFVSRRQAYHGNTIGAMSISSNKARKVPYEGLSLSNVSFVSPAFAYHYQQENETEEQYAERLVQELDDEFQRLGPQNVISFIAEPIVGATSGCVPAPRGYFKGVRRVCDKYGILLHLDEIMCGTGRTGTYFAFEQEGILPDIVTIGKGLGGGYLAIAAMLINGRVVDVLRAGTSSFNHGHTYQAHPVHCASALAVNRILRRENLVERAGAYGRKLEKMLKDTFSECRYVGDIRGRGLFWALEFVRDKTTKTPFDKSIGFSSRMHRAAFELGVAIYPGSGTYDGDVGDHVLFAPAYTVTDEELRIMVSTTKEAYDQEIRKLGLA